jgi:hypothetical protein
MTHEFLYPKQKNSNNIVFILLGLVVSAFLIGGFFFHKNYFSQFLSSTSEDATNLPIIIDDPEEEAVEYAQNYLTGEDVPKAEAEDWINTRPLGVMMNNHIDARPHSGLIYADLVYEVVAEGGITRILPFYLSNIPEKIGPVRSTRPYYLTLVKETGDAMLMHIGYSPQALEAIETWPVRSLSRGGASFYRDNPYNVATEHTAFVVGPEIKEIGLNLGWDGTSEEFEMWEYKEDSNDLYNQYGSANSVMIDFWYKGDYSANWEYKTESNSYLRYTGYENINTETESPSPHVDRETSEQVEMKNVIVQFAQESPIPGDDKSRLQYELIGSGEGLAFIDGQVIPLTWVKESRDLRTKFYDLDGEVLKLNKGKTWISIVPSRNADQVIYNVN